MLPAFTKERETLKNEEEQKVLIGELKMVITQNSKKVVRLGHCGKNHFDCSFVKLNENINSPAPAPCFPGFGPFATINKPTHQWEQPPEKKISYRYPVYESKDLEALNKAFNAKDYVKYAEYAVGILEEYDKTNCETEKNTFSTQALIDGIKSAKSNFIFDYNTMTQESRNTKGM